MNAEQGLHLRPVRMGSLRAEAETRADGTVYVRSLETLAPYPRSMTDRLAHWATATPDAVFIADRGDDFDPPFLKTGGHLNRHQVAAARGNHQGRV